MKDRLVRAVGLRWPHRILNCRRGGAVVSVSFDDFPTSAIERGGPILEKKGFAATYFVSGSLADDVPNTNDECVLTKADVRKVASAGHEIGCHTFSHLDCQSATKDELAGDIEKNRSWISDCTGINATSFAYPMGRLSLSAKKTVSRYYPIARSIRPGVNSSWADLSALRANHVYHHDFSANCTQVMLEKLVVKGGWLIFYTHDVCTTPSNYGCTVEQFESLIELISQSGATVLTMAQALERIAFAQRGKKSDTA